MAENTPNPAPGATPPKPVEAAKVQPKKETVRINLPPKPTAAPTIKIPAPSAVASATPAPAAPVAAMAAATPASAPPPMPTAAPTAAQRAAPAAAPRTTAASRPAAARAGVSGIDVGLASTAAVIAVAVVVRVFFLSQ